MFHRFPKPVERRRLWLAALGIPSTTPEKKIKQYSVCEEHFKREDYKQKMPYASRKMVLTLKKTAVPFVFDTEAERSASSMPGDLSAVQEDEDTAEVEESLQLFALTSVHFSEVQNFKALLPLHSSATRMKSLSVLAPTWTQQLDTASLPMVTAVCSPRRGITFDVSSKLG
ncbi:hypothetical protein ACEWY4_012583 [Coilia grayii]|uniref:THAP domain-containing protein 1 n=1 Tax=Coilia grayii TaxID=363190 RepID=A0ABD1K0Y0_9TELE